MHAPDRRCQACEDAYQPRMLVRTERAAAWLARAVHWSAGHLRHRPWYERYTQLPGVVALLAFPTLLLVWCWAAGVRVVARVTGGPRRRFLVERRARRLPVARPTDDDADASARTDNGRPL